MLDGSYGVEVVAHYLLLKDSHFEAVVQVSYPEREVKLDTFPLKMAGSLIGKVGDYGMGAI